MKKLITAAFVVVSFPMFLTAQPIPGVKQSVKRLNKDIPVLMREADIPGLSVALVRDGKIVWAKHFGVMNADTRQPITDSTIFEAASLTKMVYAYAVMKLVDQGKINLDIPLNKYLGNNYDVGNDARMDSITARRVLTHSSGFPNWRAKEGAPLPIQFSPGSKFSYSGEGFVYLSKVVEKITGIPTAEWVQQSVLTPLGMTNSIAGLPPLSVSREAYRHNAVGQVSSRNDWPGFNPAASLRTTAADYARFAIALMNGEGLSEASWHEMMTTQINVNQKSPNVFWGLGVGLEKSQDEKAFWHWGDQGDSKGWITADLEHKNAVIYFSNSANGLSITREILADGIGGSHPGVAWLDYERYNSIGKSLQKDILTRGAQPAIAVYLEKVKTDNSKRLTEAQINTLGYLLLNLKKTDDAILVLAQNTIDYPSSSNAWDSFAEAYMNKGDKTLAIRYYEKALELNPGSTNAVEQLKKLRTKE